MSPVSFARLFSAFAVSLSLVACAGSASSTPKQGPIAAVADSNAPSANALMAAPETLEDENTEVSESSESSESNDSPEIIIESQPFIAAEEEVSSEAPACDFELITRYNAIEYSIRSAKLWSTPGQLRMIQRQAVAFQEQYEGVQCRTRVNRGPIRVIDASAAMQRKIDVIEQMLN